VERTSLVGRQEFLLSRGAKRTRFTFARGLEFGGWGMSLTRLFAAALLAAPVSFAFAADLPPRPAPPMLSPVPVYNWTGIYVGINGGGGWGSQNPLALVAPQFGQNNSFSLSGGVVGGTIGGQVQVNHVVLGLEADADWAGIKGSSTVPIPSLPGTSLRLSTQDNAVYTARSRIGYAADNWLFYGTAGVAALNGAARGSVLSGAAACGSVSLPNCSNSQLRPGATVGLGVEYGFAPNWSGKVEYLWTGAVAGASTDSINMIRAGLNYRFGG
jgi:outer membrane immunogenic protein